MNERGKGQGEVSEWVLMSVNRMATNRLITIAIITVLVLLIIAVIFSKFR